jgi:hypothetical protein
MKHFFATEYLSGENAYACEVCDMKTEADKVRLRARTGRTHMHTGVHTETTAVHHVYSTETIRLQSNHLFAYQIK